MTSRITLSEVTRVQRLEPVTCRVRVVVDTDAANEIDDHFALAYAILSPERLAVEAVYAAPFQRPAPGAQDTDSLGSSVSPREGMAQSHADIMRVLEALDAQDLVGNVHLGAEEWLPDAETPIPNPAADDLIARTRQWHPDADSWGNQPSRHLIREIRDVNADAILNDFFAKLPTI